MRIRRSKILETPSHESGTGNTRTETPITSDETLTNCNVDFRKSLDNSNLENRITEPSQTSNEIQVWAQIFE